MASKKKKVRGKRLLLNDPGYHSTACIIAEIQDTRGWPEGKDGDGYDLTSAWRMTPDVTLEITDCDKKISFEIDWASPQDRKASLKKVDRLIDALDVFREALVDEMAMYAVREKACEKENDE